MFSVHPRAVFLIIALVVFVAGPSVPLAAQDATPGTGEVTILGPDEEYAGATLGEWNARWWQWVTSFPMETNPNFDPTGGDRCGYGQAGPVFLLPVNFTGEPIALTCTVPEGMALFVPLYGTECSTVEPPPYFGRDEAELRACATTNNDVGVELEMSINGQDVPDLETYRTSSPLFPLTFAEDNFFGVPAGVGMSVTDAYALIIAPLPPGEYELVVSTRLDDEPEPIVGTYQIIVLAPQVIEPEATPEGTPEAATPVA